MRAEYWKFYVSILYEASLIASTLNLSIFSGLKIWVASNLALKRDDTAALVDKAGPYLGSSQGPITNPVSTQVHTSYLKGQMTTTVGRTIFYKFQVL